VPAPVAFYRQYSPSFVRIHGHVVSAVSATAAGCYATVRWRHVIRKLGRIVAINANYDLPQSDRCDSAPAVWNSFFGSVLESPSLNHFTFYLANNTCIIVRWLGVKLYILSLQVPRIDFPECEV